LARNASAEEGRDVNVAVSTEVARDNNALSADDVTSTLLARFDAGQGDSFGSNFCGVARLTVSFH